MSPKSFGRGRGPPVAPLSRVALSHQHNEDFVTSAHAGAAASPPVLPPPEPTETRTRAPSGLRHRPGPPRTTSAVEREGRLVPESLEQQTRGSQKEPLNVLPVPRAGLSTEPLWPSAPLPDAPPPLARAPLLSRGRSCLPSLPSLPRLAGPQPPASLSPFVYFFPQNLRRQTEKKIPGVGNWCTRP